METTQQLNALVNQLDPVQRLSRDLAKAAMTLSDAEARYLVDAYYQTQDQRMRSDNQARTQQKIGEPHGVLSWLADQSTILESQVKRALDKYTEAHVMGSWMRSIHGIGPVISAGLLAHININKAPTVGHIWRYAGLDPTVTWQGRVKAEALMKALKEQYGNASLPEMVEIAARKVNRKSENYYAYLAASDFRKEQTCSIATLTKWLAMPPWNGQLKTLCWKIGESWVKHAGSEKCYYGHFYLEFKQKEIERNEAGGNAETAKLRVNTVGKGTEAREHYEAGRLPPAQIHARAKRKATKLFLAHMHGEWYRRAFDKEPPLPYPIAFMGHTHFIGPEDRVDD